MKLSDLTLPNNEFDSDDILSEWRWLVGEDAKALVVTKAGDAFVQKADGIYFLNLGENRFQQVCDSIPAFKELLAGRDFVSKHFLPQVQSEFVDSGQILGPSQVIGFKLPPITGGSFDLANLEPTDVSVHFSILGQIARKIKDLPDGTPLGKFTVE
jgi:hypothetical protein